MKAAIGSVEIGQGHLLIGCDVRNLAYDDCVRLLALSPDDLAAETQNAGNRWREPILLNEWDPFETIRATGVKLSGKHASNGLSVLWHDVEREYAIGCHRAAYPASSSQADKQCRRIC